MHADLDPRFRDRMTGYISLLDRWRRVTNLVSDASFEQIWTRHILDCAQLRLYAPTAVVWVDIGSGAGLPGLIIAAQLADTPKAVVHCIESDQRKCAFLRAAIRTLDLPAVVHPKRVEDVSASDLGHVDAITARAVAPLQKLLHYAAPFFSEDTIAVFPRGRSEETVLDPLQEKAFQVERSTSAIDSRAYVLRIRRNL